jgi:hypothetical protein
MKIKETTLVAVSSTRIEETLYALRYSMGKIAFDEVKLLTSANLPKVRDIRVQSINPLHSLDEYSDFIIYELHKYIESRFCLIVQWDGFVINERLWSDSFFDYDYIGAPFKRRPNDPNYSTDDQGKFYAVGTGGFSWRSKELLEAPSSMGLTRPLWSGSSNEDGFFCVENRRQLEAEGFRWAPEPLAAQFSNECGMRDRRFIQHSFGFHGVRLLQRHRFMRFLGGCGY